MSQRGSGYTRRPDEDYPTPAWLAAVFADWLQGEGVSVVWEPAPGEGYLASALTVEGLEVIATHDDFFRRDAMPQGVNTIATNPPFGKGGRQAVKFIRHAFKLEVERMILLLKVDFDSGKTRTDLFRHFCLGSAPSREPLDSVCAQRRMNDRAGRLPDSCRRRER
jgi:hypothetical protein